MKRAVSLVVLTALLMCLGIGARCEKEPEVIVKPMMLLVGNIEVDLTFNINAGATIQGYQSWASGVISKIKNAPGCTRCQPMHNMLDSPKVKWISAWNSLKDWATFTESNEWQDMLSDLHSKYANDINIEIWKVDLQMKVMYEKQPEEIQKPDTL